MSTARTETDRVLSGLLEDKVAIVTGASRGIGAAAARAFAAAGAAVVLAARDQHALTSAAEEIVATGVSAARSATGCTGSQPTPRWMRSAAGPSAEDRWPCPCG